MTHALKVALTVCAIFCLTATVRAGNLIEADERTHFPILVGKNLLGKKFVIPRELDGKMKVIVLAFTREHQPIAETWFNQLDALSRQYDDLEYFEIPLLPKYGAIRRYFVWSSLKADIVTEEQRARTVVVYTDKDAFLKEAGIANDEKVRVLLIDKDGRIAWRTEGRVSSAKASALEMNLRALVDEIREQQKIMPVF